MATKVSHVRLTPFTVSHRTPGEPALLAACDRISPRLGRAATAGDEQEEGREEGDEAPPAQVPLAVLQQRAGIMFSGKTGAVVVSGEGAATSAPSYGLAKGVIELTDDLPDALFDRHAEHRPCGLLCRYGAGGMLIGDLLGLPLIPWALAEPIGKAAAKAVKEIPAEIKKAKKKARRKGSSAEEAAAAVLRRHLKLKLPTAADIKAAWRQIATATQPQEPPPPPPPPPPPTISTPEVPPAPLPPPSVPLAESTPQVDYAEAGDTSVGFWATARHPEIPGYRGRPGGDQAERYWNPAKPPCVPSDHRPAHLFNSREAAEASGAASRVERFAPRPEEDYAEDECFECYEEEYEIACVRHKHTLRRLHAAFPEVGEEHHTRPCPCGRGALAVWPWVVQTAQLGYCECWMAGWELTCWRGEWIQAGYPNLAY